MDPERFSAVHSVFQNGVTWKMEKRKEKNLFFLGGELKFAKIVLKWWNFPWYSKRGRFTKTPPNFLGLKACLSQEVCLSSERMGEISGFWLALGILTPQSWRHFEDPTRSIQVRSPFHWRVQ